MNDKNKDKMTSNILLIMCQMVNDCSFYLFSLQRSFISVEFDFPKLKIIVINISNVFNHNYKDTTYNHCFVFITLVNVNDKNNI
jgi:hypothetical protein